MAFPKRRPTESAEQHGAHLREVHIDPEFAQSRIALELCEARRRRGGDLQNIAEELRIRYDHLLALEEARFDDLPGPTYVIGFLRSYAGYLDLDAEDLIHRFKTEVSNYGAQQKLHFPAPSEEGRVPTGPLLIVALALAGASYAAWYYMTSVDRLSGRGVPEVPAQIMASVPPADPAQLAPSTIPLTASSSAAPTTPNTTSEPAAQPQPEAAPVPETIVAAVEPERAEADAAADAALTPTVEPEPDTAVVDNETDVAPQSVAVSDANITEAAPDPAVAPSVASDSTGSADVAAQTAAVEPEIRATGTQRPVTDSRNVRPGEVGGAELKKVEAIAAEEQAPAATREPETEAATTNADAGETRTAAVADLPQVPPPPVAVSEYVPRVFGQGNVASRISVRAKHESWVQITGVDNELLLTRILRPGDVYHVPDKPGLVLLTGNAGGIEILVDGTVAPQLGPVAAVRRGVMLDAEKLLAGEAVIR